MLFISFVSGMCVKTESGGKMKSWTELNTVLCITSTGLWGNSLPEVQLVALGFMPIDLACVGGIAC